MVVLRFRRGLLSAIVIALFFLFSGGLWAAPESGAAARKSFEHNGDVLYQSFYLARDLPLTDPSIPPCPAKDTNRNSGQTRCREEVDFHRIRFRLNLAFRPTPYAEILYGMEVGFINFGSEPPDSTGGDRDFGPGSGGKGGGKTNLETREFVLRLHNKEDTYGVTLGVFSFGTPKGIVLATSGAGAKFNADYRDWNSSFELVYVRSVDNSQRDIDSNGYSDDNYADIEVGMLNWTYTGIRGLRTQTYGVVYSDRDDSTSDPTESNQETSRVLWGGVFLQYKTGRWKYILHGITNQGSFERPFAYQPPDSYWISGIPILSAVESQRTALEAAGTLIPLRRKYDIDAMAGQTELSYRITDHYELVGAAAAGSGRPSDDTDPNGRKAEFRRDQFRTGGSYQFSEIGVDASGGYSLFTGGSLSGIFVRGLSLKGQVTPTLRAELGYYTLKLVHTPTIDGNTHYRRKREVDRPSTYMGQEVNFKLSWRPYRDLRIDFVTALFDAGRGYKVLRDVEYGDRVFESSLSVRQRF